ncbi:MAG: hypothetical protein AAF224_05165 [Pseudomonadota bacterium]
MKSSILDLPSFGDKPAAHGPFSVHDLADFANGAGLSLIGSRFGADDDIDVETLVAEAATRGREEGYAEGVEAGKAEALQGVEAALLERLEATLGGVDDVSTMLETDRLAFLENVFRTLLPNLSKCGFAAEAAAAIETAVLHNEENGGAIGTLHLSCAPGVGAQLKTALSNFISDNRVIISESPEFSDGALRLAWREGGLDLDIDGAVNAVLDRLSAHIPDTLRADMTDRISAADAGLPGEASESEALQDEALQNETLPTKNTPEDLAAALDDDADSGPDDGSESESIDESEGETSASDEDAFAEPLDLREPDAQHAENTVETDEGAFEETTSIDIADTQSDFPPTDENELDDGEETE